MVENFPFWDSERLGDYALTIVFRAEDRTSIYCFNISHKFSGLTKMTNSPGFGEAVVLPQEFGQTMPCCSNCFVEMFVNANHE